MMCSIVCRMVRRTRGASMSEQTFRRECDLRFRVALQNHRGLVNETATFGTRYTVN